MRALLVPPGLIPLIREVDISAKDPLRDLYAYIHCSMVQPTPPGYLTERLTIKYFQGVTMLFDEEARLVGNQLYNERASRLYGYEWHRGTLLGPVILLGLKEAGNWSDLPASWTVDNLTTWLKHRNENNLLTLTGGNAHV